MRHPTFSAAGFLLLQVLARVVVKGKAYTCAGSGCVAVPALLFDAVLEYVPQTPKERLMSVDYVAGTAAQGQCNL
jgi:hypothetical protein